MRFESQQQQIEWAVPPNDSPLAPDEVHLWCADLTVHSFPLPALHSMLSEEEKQRAQRFRFEKGRTQFIVARSLLRIILGRYLPIRPAALGFEYGAQGKPQLRNAPALRFNLAHSEALILYAVSWQREVGIDVEHIRAEPGYESIAEQFFSPAEGAALRNLPFEQQLQAFFNCWTRKEAYIKARGEGLSFPLEAFAVSLGFPVTLRVNQSAAESQRWQLYHLNPKPAYVGALAVEGRSHTLRFYTTRDLPY